MALSALNKNFLSALHKLDIDVKQFPDKSFDGSFDFVPDSVCHFFNWFLENITPENALTRSERVAFYFLESTHSLPSQKEINIALTSFQPSFEELMSMDMEYVNNFLPQEFDDLKRYQDEVSDIQKKLESNYNEAKKNQITLKEHIKEAKKDLFAEQEGFTEANANFKARVNEVKLFLLKQPSFILRLDLLRELLALKETIFSKLKSYKFLENDTWDCSKLGLLSDLGKDLVYVEISNVLTNGFLLIKKAERDFLLEILKKNLKSSSYYLTDAVGIETELCSEVLEKKIRVLESELLEIRKKTSLEEIQKISEEYTISKSGIYRSYTSELLPLLEYLKSSSQLNAHLFHILLRCKLCLKGTISSKKLLKSKLNECETKFSNNITSLELRQQRFSEITTFDNQHPLLSELENSERFEESLKNVFDLMSKANEDSDAVTSRTQLQSSIQEMFRTTLRGPTHDLLLIPVELLIKFHEEKDRVGSLSQGIKRHATKYVETKEKILKQQRKELLAWVNFITNPQT